MNLTGKVALVTGGASGIGLAIVEELLENGLKAVVIADINSESGEKVTDELLKKYKSSHIVFQKTNVVIQQDCEAAFQTAINKFGQLDIVINNAGIVDEPRYEDLINTNVTSVVHGTDLALKYMSKHLGGKGGVVLSTSSMVAVNGFYCMPIYSTTKAAVIHLMRAFGDPFHYNKSGIRMMSMCPGRTETTILENLKLHSFVPDARVSMIEFRDRPSQKPSGLAKAAIHIIKHGETATTWVIEGNKLYLLKFPELQPYANLIDIDA